MRVQIDMPAIGVALCVALGASTAMAQTVESGGSASMVQGEYHAPGPGCCDPRNDYKASLTSLKWEIDRQTRKDGGHLTAAHEAKLQSELDDINRRFHQGRFAKAQRGTPAG